MKEKTNPPSEQHSAKTARHEEEIAIDQNETMGDGERMHANASSRFFSKVKKTETCWIWTAAKHYNGYGCFVIKKGHNILAHRFSYEIHKGQISKEMEIDHLCRNRACVNPAHLEAVTHKENILRSPLSPFAINARKTHCKRGHELKTENLIISKTGSRKCRICDNESQRRNYHKNKTNSNS